MKRAYAFLLPSILTLALWNCTRPEKAPAPEAKPPAGKLIARVFDSGFALSHDTYNGISTASDGRIFYVLCAQSLDNGAQMFSFDPAADKIQRLGDLTEASGEKGAKSIPQGKSHVAFHEANGKLYFATHVDFYTVKNGREMMGVPPPGYKPYPGGHFLSYDMASGKYEDLAKAPTNQGIISMAMDTSRGRLYGLTWPSGLFLRYDLKTKELKNLGPVSHQGEAGTGPTYRTLCRSLVVNPDDGSVYFTNAEGTILRYVLDRDAIEDVKGEDLKKDYFGTYDPTSPGHMGYNWRQAFWYAPEKAIYAVHGNSGYLFKFDPRIPQVDVIERITSEPSRKSGMFDKFYYGYLGFALGPDGRTIHYLTGGPIIENGKRVIARNTIAVGAKGDENLHLVTYDIVAGKYADHGPISYKDGGKPSYVNSIAVGKDGAVYALARVSADEHARTDLIQIPGPLMRQK